MSPTKLELTCRRDTRRLAARLGAALRAGDLVVLAGELGAGKTFFTRALARALGVPREARVASPTFALVHEHEGHEGREGRAGHGGPARLAHADLYRLGDARELDELGLVEARREGAVLVVEWGAPYVDELGGDALMLTLTHAPGARDTARQAHAEATGPRSRELLEALSVEAPSSEAPRREPRAR
jgi:tRNA threonylcarbamoyladenosine biosynthesis protein TsaE